MTNPLLAKVYEAHLAYKTAKVREFEIAKLQAEARVQDLLDARNALAAAAADEGIPVRQIALHGLGIKNQQTAKDAVLAGRALRGAAAPAEVEAGEAEPAERERYTWDGEVLTVFMEHAEFKPFASALPVEPSEDGEEFTFTYDGSKLLPTTRDYEHPVVVVMMHEKAQREAIAFIESQKEK